MNNFRYSVIDFLTLRKTLAGLFFILLGFHSSIAQNYAEYNWMFGDSDAAMVFNKSDGLPVLDTTMAVPFGIGGGVTISDPVTGDLLFYTDGVDVYDADHELVPSNGGGLNGNSSINRAAEVFPMPYSDGRYFIFTNSGSSGVNEIQYSVVDRTVAGNAAGGEPARGDLVAGMINLSAPTPLSNPSEGMLVIHRDIDNYWLISQDRTTDEIRVTAIASGVIGATANYDPWTLEAPGFEVSDFAFNPGTGELAMAPKESNVNVTLLNFDLGTGAITLNRVLTNTGNTDFASESIYGVEWSRTGFQLYISRHGSAGVDGNLYQIDFNDPTETPIAVLDASVFRSYGVKRGPDQRIYHLYQQTSSSAIEIGVIAEADSTIHEDSVGRNVGYAAMAFADPSGINGQQFPATPAQHFESFTLLDFFVADTCTGQRTKFFSSVEPTPETYNWSFGDGGTSNGVSPIHTYDGAGTFNVSLEVSLNGVIETFSRSVTIASTAFTIDLGQDTIRCIGESFELDAGDGGLLYYWNTGETTQSIDADTTYVYQVAVLTPEGCWVNDYIGIQTYQDNREFRNQWYFGEQAGIDFNEPVSAITDENIINSPQAASAVSDINGELSFYTDGQDIYSRDHEVMLSGDAIGGDNTSMQGVMTVPIPGDSSYYYVFTTDPVWGDYTYNMKYSVVDMRRDSADGQVLFKDMSFMQNSSERMTAFGLGDAFSWLITHEYGNNRFKSYPINDEGIGAPLTSVAGSVLQYSEEKMGTAELQVAQSGNLLAMAIQDTNDNYVEIFNINDSTGLISLLVQVDINEPAPSLVYGLEFSSSGEHLYVTTNGNGSQLLQYDLFELFGDDAETEVTASKFVVATSSNEFGALATGPNGVIYLAVDGQGALGTIGNSNGNDDATLTEDGFDLGGRTSRLGLPNFVQSIPTQSLEPGIAYDNPCLGQPTVLEGTGTSNIDNFFWTFGDGQFAVVEDTTKVYGVVGEYDVSLRITNRCGLDTTFLETIDIQAIPLTPTVTDAVTICNGPVTLAAWPRDSAELSYTWSTGQTTREVTIDQPALISVFITDTTGCQSEPAFSFIEDTSPSLDLGNDRVVCQNEEIADLDALNPGSSFSWSIDGINTGNFLSIQSVETSTQGEFVYSVEVTDIFDCTANDSVVFTIQPQPEIDVTSAAALGCGAANGEIDIDVLGSGNYTYSITGPVNIGLTGITGPGSANENTLSAGGYSVEVMNLLSGCAVAISATIEDSGALFDIDGMTGTPGCEGEGILEINMSGGGGVPSNLTYELYDASGFLTVNSSATPVADAFSITSLDSGTYSIVVRDANLPNCIQTFDDFVLAGLPVADYIVQGQFICDGEGRIGLLPVTTEPSPIAYTWSGPNIVGSAVGDSISVGAAGIYTVVSSGTGLCPITSLVEVVSNNSPDVEIIVDGESCDGEVVISAAVSGNVGSLGYEWENGQRTSQRRVFDTETYEVVVLDQGSGCTSSTSSLVEVYDDLEVFLVVDPNCDNNEEVLLSAFSNITEDVSFLWTGPEGEISDTDAILNITQGGDHTVVVSSEISECTATASMPVVVQPIEEDQLLLENNETICTEDPDPQSSSVVLDPGSFSSYEWNFVNSAEIISTDRLLTVSEAGAYEVRMTNGFTCITDLIEVFDDCAPRVYAPDAFTPDGNGLNDQFFVYENPYVTDFNIKIFSRWGEMIYQSSDITFRWNGVYDGVLLPQGTYVYVITFESSLQPERGTVVQRGGVALLR